MPYTDSIPRRPGCRLLGPEVASLLRKQAAQSSYSPSTADTVANGTFGEINLFLLDLAKPEKIEEKTDFFLSRIGSEINILVDIGCADGSITSAISARLPQSFCIGYDLSEHMILRARARETNVLKFCSDWVRVAHLIAEARLAGSATVAVFLSSVLHEVYTSSSSADLAAFWGRVLSLQPAYLLLRDFLWDLSDDQLSDPPLMEAVRSEIDEEVIDLWERRWGPLSNLKSLCHLLAKYNFLTSRHGYKEFCENYLSVPIGEIRQRLRRDYKTLSWEKYNTATDEKRWLTDFGIQMRTPLRFRTILRRTRP